MRTPRGITAALMALPTTHQPFAIGRALSRTVAVTVFCIAVVPIHATADPCLPLLTSFVTVLQGPGHSVEFRHTTNYQANNYWLTGHSRGFLQLPATAASILSGTVNRTWDHGGTEAFSLEFYADGSVRFAGQFGPYPTTCYGDKFLTVNTGDSFETFTFTTGAHPTPADLAYHWAPIHYQDVNKKDDQGRKDFITRVDRDGVWDVSLNWNVGSYRLEAWVYYSVVTTPSHAYLTYAFYHPLDWDSGEDKNDLEGALFIVKWDGTRWGRLEAVITVWHTHFHAYFPRDTPLVSGCKIEAQGECWIQWQDGRVKTSQEWGGHGFGFYPAYVKENDDAVVYVPSQQTAGVPPSIPDGTHVQVPYQLVDIHAPGGLWAHRRDKKVFNAKEDYLEFVGGHGNPPWAWDDGDDGGLCLKGIWTHDPALLAQYYFKLKDPSLRPWEYFNREYTMNPYRSDMDILTYSNAKELYSNPLMSLEYWMQNYGGSCAQMSTQYPCE